MSSYTANIARWNAIPMTRESTESTGTKRSRSRSRSRSASPVVKLKLEGEYDSSDEDDVSLISRSPSPSLHKTDIMTYDKYHPAPEKEVITVETKIKSTNKGYSILSKLGWMAGQPLGLSGDGRVDPIPFSVKNDLTGLGKRAQDERMIETTVSQRRGLDSERQIKETFEQRQSREQKVAEKEALATQIASTLKPFYCALCEKQYQTVAQYDEHTNSYAHHHKQRFKDMQTNAKGLGGGKQDKEVRLAKERRREEKELKRMAKAQGVKVGAVPGGVVAVNALSSGASLALEESKGFKKSGWAAVSSSAQSAQAPTSNNEPPKKSGWTAASDDAQSAPLGVGRRPRPVNPGFRTAGFETLETTSLTPSSKTDEGSTGSDGSAPQLKSRWSNISTPGHVLPPAAPPPPPPPPPPFCPPPPPPPSYSVFPRPPPGTLPAPPPDWPPQLARHTNTYTPSPSYRPPLRNGGESPPPRWGRELSPGRYAPDGYPPLLRPPYPRRSMSPSPRRRERYEERDHGRPRYQDYR